MEHGIVEVRVGDNTQRSRGGASSSTPRTSFERCVRADSTAERPDLSRAIARDARRRATRRRCCYVAQLNANFGAGTYE